MLLEALLRVCRGRHSRERAGTICHSANNRRGAQTNGARVQGREDEDEVRKKRLIGGGVGVVLRDGGVAGCVVAGWLVVASVRPASQ